MKTKFSIIGFFILVNLFSSGQSVPNTTTFSLQDVINAVNPSSNDLNECFNDANPAYFNSTYKNQYYADYGNKNNLLMFRDYKPTVTSPSYVNNGVFATPTGNAVPVNIPTGIVTGDLLIAVIAQSAGYGFNAVPGWTVLGTKINANFSYQILYRIAVAPETPFSGYVTGGFTVGLAGIMYRFQNSATSAIFSNTNIDSPIYGKYSSAWAYYTAPINNLLITGLVYAGNDAVITLTGGADTDVVLTSTAEDWKFILSVGVSTDGTLQGIRYDWTTDCYNAVYHTAISF